MMLITTLLDAKRLLLRNILQSFLIEQGHRQYSVEPLLVIVINSPTTSFSLWFTSLFIHNSLSLSLPA